MDAPFGSWPSPVDGDVVARDPGWTHSLVLVDGDHVYWSEARSLEGGRDVIVARGPNGACEDAIPAGWSARTRVHEYGGGAYTVAGGTVYFCRDADQRVYAIRDGAPVPLTPEPGVEHGLRYADLQVAGDWLVCVRERVAEPEHVNELVAVPLAGGEPVVLEAGHDFYAAPRVSPDGSRIAWLAWDHPRMPWEGSELYVAELKEGLSLFRKRRVAGGAAEAIVQPAWSPSGELHYSSDRTGWWNLYRENGTAVTALEAEVGGPLWVFGESYYAFLDDGRIVVVYSSAGADHLAVVEDGSLRDVELEFTRIVDVVSDGRRALFIGASPVRGLRVVALDVDSGAVEPLSPDGEALVPAEYVSVPRAVEYPTTGCRTAYALFYPPHHPSYRGPEGERPPLVVRVHGGPTAHVSAILRPEIQFFTTRGFAVVDVNYGGSTGYGREYRDRLRGQWGIVDTDDAVNAARFLAESGEVDGARMTITGGSAGGWTVLSALTRYPDVFACGADYYGVADLSAFAEDTHKFESRYLDWLIDRSEWVERAPLTHADKIRVPVIVLQGDEDRVVPPSQSEVIVEALRRKGIDHEYLVFEGEQHGFRKAENLRRAAEAELAFYGRVLGFAVQR
ncbi:S9 family peptidase [Solirubrobacter sp. CPCC 204708]|uniref:Prolyl oligopeptidase family serine peptidase n=1 Tax=Solirubrobacter deserti TaxID=2282478 RepID=A0ABT4RH52_9ACTN|nr:prolyl oligopeptidase family serine peptidase [Solirubrobacter deserti]MBE2315179.1 S9 family peptidase [Solirubrobacter deserti]MDA0137862.1 prolyl oligopeptidase family serine peptidase [Solirubrobacter deserti]